MSPPLKVGVERNTLRTGGRRDRRCFGQLRKARPAVVIQSYAFGVLASVAVLPISSHFIQAPLYRITLNPSETNQLRKISQVMIDKAVTVPRYKVGQRVGCIYAETLEAVAGALRDFFDLQP